MIRKLVMALGAGGLVVGGVIGLATVTASADGASASTGALGPFTIVGGADGHSDGTATITPNPTSGTYTATLTPNKGLSFSSGFVCVGHSSSRNPGTSYFEDGTGFTARANPADTSNGCPPSGSAASYFVAQSFSGGGPWVVTDVPVSFFSDGAYLQVNVSVSNGDTGYPCAVGEKGGSTASHADGATGSGGSRPYYGNCSAPCGDPGLPVGTIGGLGAALVLGVGLVGVQRRRERVLRGRAVRQ
jgi:hypothetical protein